MKALFFGLLILFSAYNGIAQKDMYELELYEIEFAYFFSNYERNDDVENYSKLSKAEKKAYKKKYKSDTEKIRNAVTVRSKNTVLVSKSDSIGVWLKDGRFYFGRSNFTLAFLETASNVDSEQHFKKKTFIFYPSEFTASNKLELKISEVKKMTVVNAVASGDTISGKISISKIITHDYKGEEFVGRIIAKSDKYLLIKSALSKSGLVPGSGGNKDASYDINKYIITDLSGRFVEEIFFPGKQNKESQYVDLIFQYLGSENGFCQWLRASLDYKNNHNLYYLLSRSSGHKDGIRYVPFEFKNALNR